MQNQDILSPLPKTSKNRYLSSSFRNSQDLSDHVVIPNQGFVSVGPKKQNHIPLRTLKQFINQNTQSKLQNDFNFSGKVKDKEIDSIFEDQQEFKTFIHVNQQQATIDS